MKKLSELYNCDLNIDVSDIKNNSKEVKKNDLFVCTSGINSDRHDYIQEAIKAGCSAVIASKDVDYNIPIIKVKDTNKELGIISKKFYDNPCSRLKIIGITGTDGKTTTASIIRNMIGNDICGYIGTNGAYNKNNIITLNNTTPEINKIYKILKQFADNGLEYSTMEISSEALLHNRTNTLELDVAVLTNITQDHLNVHKNIDNYVKSKSKIFSLLKKDGVGVLNRDDEHFDEVSKEINNKVFTYGLNELSDFLIKNIKESEDGTTFDFVFDCKKYVVNTNLKGVYNVYNLMAAIITLYCLNYSIRDAIKSVNNIEIVSGRGEFLNFEQNYKIVLDYAHTPNALKNILEYLNKIKKGRIITVTGSAGGREKEKRSKMGSVVLNLSDYVIFTMDDPRYENPNSIIDDLISASKNNNYIRIIDRKEAIKYALDIASKNDIVLITGKGRDNYMAIGNDKICYCDYDVIEDYFKNI